MEESEGKWSTGDGSDKRGSGRNRGEEGREEMVHGLLRIFQPEEEVMLHLEKE